MKDYAPQHRRFVTLLQLMETMKERKVTVIYASERFDISTRTAYRYINVMCAAGVGVKQERGKYWIQQN